MSILADTEYHKINSIWKRYRESPHKGKVRIGDFSCKELEYLYNCEWEFTEKFDGTNIRIGIQNGEFEIGGRTSNAMIPIELLYKLFSIFIPLKETLKAEYKDTKIILYGEGYGRKIQKGGGNYIPDGVDFILFDVKIGEWWLKRKDIDGIGLQLGIKTVPVWEYTGPLSSGESICKEGFKSSVGNAMAEGLVCRPVVELKDRSGKRIICKIKTVDYALINTL